jgi:hypothetical protein
LIKANPQEDYQPLTLRVLVVSLPGSKASAVFITTLLERRTYPPRALRNLYHRRWDEKEFFKTIKEHLRAETAVGEAFQQMFQSGKVNREGVFIGTKLWNNNHRPERVRPAFEASLRRLQLEYADLYAVHTPFAFKSGDEQDPRPDPDRSSRRGADAPFST